MSVWLPLFEPSLWCILGVSSPRRTPGVGGWMLLFMCVVSFPTVFVPLHFGGSRPFELHNMLNVAQNDRRALRAHLENWDASCMHTKVSSVL